eukprot:6380333-Amphidinium_carterae.1
MGHVQFDMLSDFRMDSDQACAVGRITSAIWASRSSRFVSFVSFFSSCFRNCPVLLAACLEEVFRYLHKS